MSISVGNDFILHYQVKDFLIISRIDIFQVPKPKRSCLGLWSQGAIENWVDSHTYVYVGYLTGLIHIHMCMWDIKLG